jgi:prepilin signal peptidase PulO-like enzyme (type II secretory pathway)
VSSAIDAVFLAMLAVITVTDLRRRLIPNRVLGLALGLGLPLIVLADAGSLPERLSAALVAGGAFLVVSLTRPGAFGMGDVKLIAAIGLFLGDAVVGAVLIALCAGTSFGLILVVRNGRSAAKATIPFGPFLALGGILALIGRVPLQ